jgi:iron(III) transport system permease protein
MKRQVGVLNASSRLGRKSLGALSLLIALVIMGPILAVLWRALVADTTHLGQGSWANLQHIALTLLPTFFTNTVQLVVGVLVVVLIAGVGCAWIIAAYDFTGRAWLGRLLVLPLAMPAFVMAYSYTEFLDVSGPLQSSFRAMFNLQIGQWAWPDIRSVPGASVILGLSLFPYVYMLARPAFVERNEALAQAARTLGVSQRRLWWRVTLPVARPAIVAGCALVVMETLADFGTVAYFSVDTLAGGIYRSWQGLGDQTSAARLSVLLLVIVFFLLWLENKQRGQMASFERQRKPATRRFISGFQAVGAQVFCLVWIALGFVLPVGLLLNSVLKQWQAGQTVVSTGLVHWALNSMTLAAIGTIVIIPSALVVAYACRVTTKPVVRAAAQLAASGYALPGLVLAVGLLLLAKSLDGFGLGWVRTTIALVIFAYGARFFAVAFQGIQSALGRVAPSMDDSARSLGASAWRVLRQVHWPLLRPTLMACTMLVFVDCLKELPATLVLRPLNFDTLAVIAYQYASDERLEAVAMPSLLLVLVGLIPTIWLAKRQS